MTERIELHPTVIATLRVLAAKAELRKEQVRSKRAALPSSASSHTQAMRLHKQLQELTLVHESWELALTAAGALGEGFDERSVPGE
jgi:hypothetical protein